MKKLIFFTLCASLLASPVLCADLPVASTITHVTAYQDRALVTREGRVELEEGKNFLVFEGLPGALIEESLSSQGRGGAEVTLNGVELKKTFTPEEANPRVAKITEELEKLQYELREVQARQSALADQKGFLDSVKDFSSAQISKDIMTKSPAVSEWAGLSTFIGDSYTELGQKTLALEKAVQDKMKEIQAKQRELNDIRSGRDITRKTAVVSVDAKAKTSFDVSLSYLVPQATWHISYDAKVSPSKKTCALISYGNIRQWTGEDWIDVKLKLSSAKPAVGGRMPELSPWFVDFYQVYSASATMASSGGRLAKRAMMMDELKSNLETDGPREQESYELLQAAQTPAVLPQADVSQDMGSVNYEITKIVTVLSDNRQYKNPVKTDSFDTSLDYEATPKLSPYAFIHSKVVNNKDYSLPAGGVNVFMEDNYVGQSSIPTVGRNESFDLYLGIDEEVKVKRTELVDKKKKALLGLRARQEYAYKVELENYKKEAIKLTVIDQLPVSKNGDIKVDFLSSSMKPTETKDLGLLKWAFDLAPREKQALEFAFAVDYPSDKNVMGV